MLVVQYAKFHVFAKSWWKAIPTSCNDLINIYLVACYAKIRITKVPDGAH